MPAPDEKLIHPGTVLRERVPPGPGLLGIQIARELQVCRKTLHHTLAERVAATLVMAARPSCLSGMPARFWLDPQQAHDIAQSGANLADMPPRIRARALPPTLVKESTAYAR